MRTAPFPKSCHVPQVATKLLLRPVFDVRADIFQLREDLGKEGGVGVDPEHGRAQLVDDVHAAIPKLVLVRLDQEGFEWITDLISHVTEIANKKYVKICVSDQCLVVGHAATDKL